MNAETSKSKEEAKLFLRRVYKIPRMEITDATEKAHLLTLLALADPVSESNNQHSWTTTYDIGGQVYDVTEFGRKKEVLIERHCSWEEMGL
jgi:hypothetical protein